MQHPLTRRFAVRQVTIRSMLVLALAAVAALALVQLAFARGERQTAPTASTIQVKAGEFFFRFSSRSIRKPGKVTFVVKNVGSVSHDLKINRRTTPLISPGKTARLVVTFKKKGKFSYLCTVPGHAAAGMRGVFTVR
jgi:uncharacterized cupredoxin-like copper-binding protein